jgi:hypothetical protein
LSPKILVESKPDGSLSFELNWILTRLPKGRVLFASFDALLSRMGSDLANAYERIPQRVIERKPAANRSPETTAFVRRLQALFKQRIGAEHSTAVAHFATAIYGAVIDVHDVQSRTRGSSAKGRRPHR